VTEYTPTVDEARTKYATGATWQHQSFSTAAEEFDRMIAGVRADERERCAQIAESSTRPLPGHGSFGAGSRSQWYANGVTDAAARIRGAS
jgi:hypothetical protein